MNRYHHSTAIGTDCSDTSGTDCSDSMVPITPLRVVPIQRYRHLLTLSEYHTRANDSELTMSSIAILPLLMNLLCYQLRDTVYSIRSRQSCLLLQLLCSTVWRDTRSKHNLLDIPLLSKSHHILSTTDIRLKILMILMSWSTMNSSKIGNDIIL